SVAAGRAIPDQSAASTARFSLLTAVNVALWEEESDFNRSGFRRVGTMHGIGVNAFSEISANGAGLSFLGVGGTHQLTVLGNGAFAFQNLHEHRTGNHEVNQILEERTLGVDAVKTLGFATGQVNQA